MGDPGPTRSLVANTTGGLCTRSADRIRVCHEYTGRSQPQVASTEVSIGSSFLWAPQSIFMVSHLFVDHSVHSPLYSRSRITSL